MTEATKHARTQEKKKKQLEIIFFSGQKYSSDQRIHGCFDECTFGCVYGCVGETAGRENQRLSFGTMDRVHKDFTVCPKDNALTPSPT